MKTFKELFYAVDESTARDYNLQKDNDEEETSYKPRSKGEEDFAAAHTVTKKVHPVTPDSQHTGGGKKGDPKHHKGGNKQAMGEDVSPTREKFSTFIGNK